MKRFAVCIVLTMVVNASKKCKCNLSSTWFDSYKVPLILTHDDTIGTLIVTNTEGLHWKTGTGIVDDMECANEDETCCQKIVLQVHEVDYTGEVTSCRLISWETDLWKNNLVGPILQTPSSTPAPTTEEEPTTTEEPASTEEPTSTEEQTSTEEPDVGALNLSLDWYDQVSYASYFIQIEEEGVVAFNQENCTSWCSASGTLEENFILHASFNNVERKGVLSYALDRIAWEDGSFWIAGPEKSIAGIWHVGLDTYEIKVRDRTVTITSSTATTSGTLSLQPTGWQLLVSFQGKSYGYYSPIERLILWSDGTRWIRDDAEWPQLTSLQEHIRTTLFLSQDDMTLLLKSTNSCAASHVIYSDCHLSRWTEWGECFKDTGLDVKLRSRTVVWQRTLDSDCPRLIEKEFCDICLIKTRSDVDITVEDMLFLLS